MSYEGDLQSLGYHGNLDQMTTDDAIARSVGISGGAVPLTAAPVIPLYKDASTAGTIARMISVARGCAGTPRFLELGREGVREAGGNVDSILDWVHTSTSHQFTFLTDEHILPTIPSLPIDSQLLITPILALDHPGLKGACPSYATFAATLLLATRLPIDIYFTTIAASGEDPTEFSHVYVTVVDVNGKRVAIDCSHGASVGWEHGVAYRKRNWVIYKGTNYPSIQGDESMNSFNNLQKVRGLGDIDWGGLIAGAEQIGGKVASNVTTPYSTYQQYNSDGSLTTYSIPANATSTGVTANSILGGSSSSMLTILVLALALLGIMAPNRDYE
jgi:hypothetical protein